ncbi:hypothetical protein BC938DRAFT_475141 [Jimgerdemannia flammicorona]|uniref:Uncharacterized protein n=1 Tax=Jimgerdemannia flammicorona TaxID=994334 RepID=A0A433PZR5_9FUNG|nr:hypothetical protein BC938DRAFT_475141 [Jimgerdemannia flammicorona]
MVWGATFTISNLKYTRRLSPLCTGSTPPLEGSDVINRKTRRSRHVTVKRMLGRAPYQFRQRLKPRPKNWVRCYHPECENV